jgi:hypothetical protein
MLTTTPLPLEFRDLLNSFNAQGLKYLLVGGWAVGHHGYKRHILDIDFWIAVSSENADRLIAALYAFCGAAPSKRSIVAGRKTTEFGRSPLKVHIMCDISGVEFDHCYTQRVQAHWDGISVPVIGLDDLLKNKQASGRLKDLEDVDALSKRHKLKIRKKKK